LVQTNNGVFYGTTEKGGTSGFGTIFKINPAGTLTTLHSFGGTDGAYPRTGLVYTATAGTLCGTTAFGRTNNEGTVFSSTKAGVLTTLHSFVASDSAHPFGG
jgi:uncharacterized repeat protein (TIGR03803 family)